MTFFSLKADKKKKRVKGNPVSSESATLAGLQDTTGRGGVGKYVGEAAPSFFPFTTQFVLIMNRLGDKYSEHGGGRARRKVEGGGGCLITIDPRYIPFS